MRMLAFLVPLLGLGLLLPSGAPAQSVTVDEGTFRILVDGREVGTERFAIRRSGSGADAQIIATAEIQMEVPEGRVDLRPALQASGGDMAVSAYQVKVSGDRQEEVTMELGERRFFTRIRSERGLEEREYRAAPGTLLLDTGVAHQYYFVGHRAGTNGVTVPVMVPRERRQYDLRITVTGTETIQIGGQQVQARKLGLEGGNETRSLWLDDEGRVLRVESGDGSFVAVRERLP
jgi:hypothetical protein